MAEIWKDVVGYEGLYQVSDRGRIKSICSYVRLQNGELMKKKPHILKLQDRCGYKCVNLFKGGRSHTLNIHRLVAEAFLPNPHRYSVVNHKDENKSNNSLSNLEWCTHAYNLSYGTAQRRRAVSQGKVVLQLDKNGAFIKRHLTLMDACRDTGINFQNISQCCNNKRKTAGGYCWKFEEQQEIQRNQPIKLSKFLKMHRAFFTDKSQNMMLVSTLKNFKAKVNQDIERSKEENGSKVDNYSQVVDSNLPKSFKLNIPLFKGFANEEIEVEIYADVDGRDVSLSLVSAGANEAIEEYKNKVIDEQIEAIKGIASDIVIIEV